MFFTLQPRHNYLLVVISICRSCIRKYDEHCCVYVLIRAYRCVFERICVEQSVWVRIKAYMCVLGRTMMYYACEASLDNMGGDLSHMRFQFSCRLCVHPTYVKLH